MRSVYEMWWVVETPGHKLPHFPTIIGLLPVQGPQNKECRAIDISAESEE